MKSFPSSGALDFPRVDESGQFLAGLSVNSASKGHTGTEHLLNGSLEGDGQRFLGFSHGLGDLKNIVELDVTVVGNVLGLLSISCGLLEGLDQKWGDGWSDGNSALSVLDGDLDLNFNSLPLGSGLLDVFSDFLGWETDGGTLWCQSSGTSHLTSDNFHEHYTIN